MWPPDESAYWDVSQAVLANLSQTIDLTQDYVEAVLRYEGSQLKESMIDTALLTLFFGLFTVLTVVAAYVLFSKGIKRKATLLMLVAVAVMWVSTLVYWVATLVAAAEAYTDLLDLTSHISDGTMKMRECLYSISRPFSDTTASCIQPGPRTDNPDHEASFIMLTGVALAVNMVIGDSIVWWRAWVLWPDSRVVRCVGILMIFLTALSGAADTILLTFFGAGNLVAGDLWAIITGLCSLLTNVVATALIAYRSWEHRRIILSYLKQSSPRTQVERTLALLVESGLLYCALWVVIVVYYSANLALLSSPSGVQTARGIQTFHNIITACLIPLIGMYPTLVIIVCAVDKSLYERSADDVEAANTSIVFDRGPASLSRCRGTLSELLDASSAYYAAEENNGRSSEVPKDEGASSGEAELLAAPL